MISINFFGTHNFAAGILQAIIDSGLFEIKTVFTAPDRPAGRHQEIQKSVVKILAEKYGLPIDQPQSLKSYKLQATSYQLNIVCDYGLIIPREILSVPSHGSINVHPSLLPKYRGASPIQSVLLNGESTTGVTIMLMDEKMDHGPILAQTTVEISPTDTYTTLADKLLETAKKSLINTVQKLVLGSKMPLREQNHSLAIFCHEFKRDDGQVDFTSMTAGEIYNRWRALTPWPGVWTMIGNKRLKLITIAPVIPMKIGIPTSRSRVKPGMTMADKDHLYFTCSDSMIEVIELQPEGKKSMTALEFINGHKSLIHALE